MIRGAVEYVCDVCAATERIEFAGEAPSDLPDGWGSTSITIPSEKVAPAGSERVLDLISERTPASYSNAVLDYVRQHAPSLYMHFILCPTCVEQAFAPKLAERIDEERRARTERAAAAPAYPPPLQMRRPPTAEE